jgi:hypothetical protein
MTNKRIEKLTAEELNIVLKAFKAPPFMKANINAGGEYIIAGVMTVKKLNGEYVAIMEN